MSGASETAFAKLNLALHVRERMPDGYHRIETIFAFCEDGDRLEGTFEAGSGTGFVLTVGGPFASELGESNLVEHAWDLLRSQVGSGSNGQTRLALTKNLPVAAGLGGGSADAAAALRLLNRLWGTGLSLTELEPVATTLGADVPACLYSRAMRGSRRGDRLEGFDGTELTGVPALLVNPREPLPTSDAFGRWDGVDRGPLGNWRAGRNDLEPAASEIVPQIGTVLAWLSVQRGAELVRMSGSGATCFALFHSEFDRDTAAEAVPREWWRMATRLR